MKDFIVRQGDEMLNFLIKKFDMINVYLGELEEYGSTSNTDMGNMDDVDNIVQSLYDEDILYRKHYDYDTLYNLVWKAMDKAAKIANQKYNNKQINTNKEVMKINESQLRKIIKESVKNILKENEDFIPNGYKGTSNWGGYEMQISDNGEEARIRDSHTGEVSDWLEIQFDEEGVAYVIDTNGQEERLCDYMRY
jgi:predicted metallo-beta-lactamase superfamily hydrolase